MQTDVDEFDVKDHRDDRDKPNRLREQGVADDAIRFELAGNCIVCALI